MFTVFELRRGWIHGVGRMYFKELPSKGELIEIASVGSCYEVLDVELATYSPTAGDIVLKRAALPRGQVQVSTYGDTKTDDESEPTPRAHGY